MSSPVRFRPLGGVAVPADTELTLYRILQEASRNVEDHARARHVTVSLRKQGAVVQLTIHDDGIGFDPDQQLASRKEKGGLGVLTMRERATYVGGTLTVKSTRRNRHGDRGAYYRAANCDKGEI